MLLKDIELYFRLRYRGRSTMPERLEILQEHRKYVLNQQTKWAEYLQNLDDKIGYYKQAIEREKEAGCNG